MVIYRPSRSDFTDVSVTLANIDDVTGQVRRFLFNGSQYVIVEYNSVDDSLELNYWDTDGSQAVSRLLEKTKVLDVAYDAADERYYGLRWNIDSGFTGTPGSWWGAGTLFFDGFDTGLSTDTWKFRGDFWKEVEPSWGAYEYSGYTALGGSSSVADSHSWQLFSRNPDNERLEYYSKNGRAVLATTTTTQDDFQAYATFGMSKFLGNTSAFSMRLIDSTEFYTGVPLNNLVTQATFRGPYDSASLSSSAGRWQSAHVKFVNDSTSSKWVVTNLRLRDSHIDDVSSGLLTDSGTGAYSRYRINFYDWAYDAGQHKHFFKVDQTSGGSATLSSGVVSDVTRTFEFVDGPFAFSLVGNPDEALQAGDLSGTSLDFDVRVDGPLVGSGSLYTVSGTSGFKLGVGKTGTNLYARRDFDGSAPTDWQDIRVYNFTSFSTSTPDLSVELCADATSASSNPDVHMDDFTMESDSAAGVWLDIPTLSIETYDSTGAISYIPGVTDASGYAIKRLNAINYSTSAGGSFSDIRDNGIVAITTDQIAAGSGGSVYILVRRNNTDESKIYKYKKSSFPISDVENDSNAYLVASGTLINPGLYKIGSFDYSTNSLGQLSYATTNYPDPERGLFLETCPSGTLSGTFPSHTAWLQNRDFIAWNVSDFDSLYGVTVTGTEAGQVKLYNMTPDTASFCHLSTRTRLLPAGTNSTSSVVGRVMNAFGVGLTGKTVAFSVTAGDGSFSPASAVTNISGEAVSTYTTGTAVTTSTLTATVNI